MFALLDESGKVETLYNGKTGFKLKGVGYPKQIFNRPTELVEIGIVEVTQDQKPSYDAASQKVVETPVGIGTEPKISWTIIQKTQEELDADTEQTQFKLEQKEHMRIGLLKATCSLKILDQYSQTDQGNGMREAIRLVRKEAKAGLTPDEEKRAAELEATDTWINSMIDFCKAKIADGSVADEVEDQWPTPPVSEVIP